MKVTCVTISETLNPVVESQLLLPASITHESEPVTWLAFTPVGQLMRQPSRRKIAELVRRAEQQFGVHMHPVSIAPSRYKGTRLSEQYVGWQMARHLARHGPGLVYARCSLATTAVIQARRRLGAGFSIVFDCRGDEAAEAVGRCGADHARPATWRSAVRRAYEEALERERIACEADEIVVVSKAMSRLLHRRQNVPEDKLRVQPCCVDLSQFPEPDREGARRRLGLTDELVVGYVGSLEWYQRPDQCLRLFKVVQGFHRNSIFLAVTSHPARMRHAMRAAGIDDSACRVLSVSKDKVPALLPAMDIGLLLRTSDPVNWVACPVKFAEYLACGVPVIITPELGDCSELVATEGLGICVPLHCSDRELAESLEALLRSMCRDEGCLARRCRRYASANLSWQSQRSGESHQGGVLPKTQPLQMSPATGCASHVSFGHE